MKQTHLFTKTRHEAPKDELSKNAILLIRAGYIHKEMAGVYSLLPLGLKVINGIKKIVAEEMEKLGSTEIIMSTLQQKELWEKTGRWSDDKVDIWFKTELKNGNQIGLGWSHEEPIVEMMRSHITSYKDLPSYVHQFQNKLRNEVRAKSGIMRCREFVMKDMYSFSTTENEHMDFYNKTIEAYMKLYHRVGLGDTTYVTSASGGVFTDKFSHEFQTVCEAGEDTIYVHTKEKYAINEEVWNAETLKKLNAEESDFTKHTAAEVGNIFTFGTEKCEQMGLVFNDVDSIKKPVYLGSYGIGITRLMGVITEAFADEKGIVWPKTVTPFHVHLLYIKSKEESVKNTADELYKTLIAEGFEVLYDDRDAGAGEKFADSDLMGIPLRIVVSERNHKTNSVEWKERTKEETTIVPYESLPTEIKRFYQK